VKRKYSLKGKSLFSQVYRKGRRYRGRFITIIVLKCSEDRKDKTGVNRELYFKSGISVGKKLGKASMRNTIKRRIRAVLQGLLPSFNDGYCIVVRPYPGIETVSWNELQDEIRNLLSRAGVVK
jgi:ribonuclease P protein component